ncbi:unnamed protein product [Moneuplotes crassus]|uniref:Uncharacterized protein n=1 Tax=Euplotes crassus TaxID=5936 RepID=A0AAD1XRP7_EUPCR|nr:unnamed protein product [Moneuplotes crassus]
MEVTVEYLRNQSVLEENIESFISEVTSLDNERPEVKIWDLITASIEESQGDLTQFLLMLGPKFQYLTVLLSDNNGDVYQEFEDSVIESYRDEQESEPKDSEMAIEPEQQLEQIQDLEKVLPDLVDKERKHEEEKYGQDSEILDYENFDDEEEDEILDRALVRQKNLSSDEDEPQENAHESFTPKSFQPQKLGQEIKERSKKRSGREEGRVNFNLEENKDLHQTEQQNIKKKGCSKNTQRQENMCSTISEAQNKLPGVDQDEDLKGFGSEIIKPEDQKDSERDSSPQSSIVFCEKLTSGSSLIPMEPVPLKPGQNPKSMMLIHIPRFSNKNFKVLRYFKKFGKIGDINCIPFKNKCTIIFEKLKDAVNAFRCQEPVMGDLFIEKCMQQFPKGKPADEDIGKIRIAPHISDFFINTYEVKTGKDVATLIKEREEYIAGDSGTNHPCNNESSDPEKKEYISKLNEELEEHFCSLKQSFSVQESDDIYKN